VGAVCAVCRVRMRISSVHLFSPSVLAPLSLCLSVLLSSDHCSNFPSLFPPFPPFPPYPPPLSLCSCCPCRGLWELFMDL
jgi:hypothetical protein